MGNILFTNNASGLLAAGISAIDTSWTLESGKGALFPSPSGATYAILTIEDTLGNFEIVHLTSRAGDVLTVARAQEGTVAQAFASGSRVELRITAAALNEWLQSSGDTFTGTLDGSGGGVISGAKVTLGEIVNTPIRGDTGVTTNQLVVPSGGGPPTIGGSNIYTVANLTQAAVNAIAFPVGTILMFYGALGNIPAGFQICDGTNGTPDLRDRFVVGAGTSYAMGATGGAVNATSGAGGDHTPTIQGTALTADQLPAHTHRLWVSNGTNSDDQNAFSSASTIAVAGDNSSNRAYREANNATEKLIENTGAAATAHTHVADAVPAHTHSVDTRSPYMALYLIMKI